MVLDHRSDRPIPGEWYFVISVGEPGHSMWIRAENDLEFYF